MVEKHRQKVDELVRQGAVPIVEQNLQEVMDRLREVHKRNVELRRKHPYSWIDAFHDAFQITRREYRN